MRYVATETDDRRHRLALLDDRYRPGHLKTSCGRLITGLASPEAAACHICLPGEAHPMEPVWALCRRLDARFNAGAGAPR